MKNVGIAGASASSDAKGFDRRCPPSADEVAYGARSPLSSFMRSRTTRLCNEKQANAIGIPLEKNKQVGLIFMVLRKDEYLR